MKLIARFTVLFAVATCFSFAQTAHTSTDKTILWSPPNTGWWDSMPQPTVPKEMIGTLRVADVPIILEETNLKDAKKRFGAIIGSRGDAGEALGWLCLHGSDADGTWILWLTSSEMDGPHIGGFQWRRLAANEIPDRRCALLPQDKSGIQLPIALHPGMTAAEVQKVLGQPTVKRGKTLFFCHEHQRVVRKENYTVSNNVAIVFRDGLVWAIEAAKTTSN